MAEAIDNRALFCFIGDVQPPRRKVAKDCIYIKKIVC